MNVNLLGKQILVLLSPLFVADTNIIFRYNFEAPLKYSLDSLYLFLLDFLLIELKLTNNSLREKCPNTEFFLVRIFLHSD